MKRVVITGASRGIGRATAEKFLDEGWEVVGTSTSGRDWARHGLSWLVLNLADSKSVAQAAQDIGALEGVDVLVDNAGIVAAKDRYGDVVSLPALRETLEVNLFGTIDLTEQLIPQFVRGGHIVIIGSGSGSIPQVSGASLPSYSISKAALAMYARKLALQLEPVGITVSLIDPGWVRTDMTGPAAHRDPSEAAAEIFARATSDGPTGRFWHKDRERHW